MRAVCVAALCLAHAASAGSLDRDALEREFARIAHGFDGRVGVCASDGSIEACLNGDQRFSMQSVVKLPVSMAIMDAVEHRGWSLDESLTVRKQDLSLFVQPLAKIVNAQGSFRTTIGDLVRRAIVDSDSAAVDILIRRLGGPQAVQAFLDRKAIRGVRIDRDERHLQTEIVGLTWKPEFTDAAVLQRAIRSLPKSARDAANRRYEVDVHDTATPRGMAAILQELADGTVLSPASCRHLVEAMRQTVTFPDRLKAGTPPGWTIAHKTGTSGTWDGITVATNDVGILGAPDGRSIAVAAFIGDSRATDPENAHIIAQLAAATVSAYH